MVRVGSFGRRIGHDRGLLLGFSALLLVVLVDAISGVQLTGAYASGAIVASMLTSAKRTALVAFAAVSAALLGGLWSGNIGSRDWGIRALTCAALAGLAVVSATIRERREARLRRMTLIAETAQHAVLRSMPTAVGSVGFAARYVSATAEALIGGDLYEVAATPYGVRVIVGDVRGKGLGAVRTAASVLGAFRQAAFIEADLAVLAGVIDEVVTKLVDDEEFITAILAEFHEGRVVLVNCGHHPPALLAGEDRALTDTGEPALPLGLGTQPELSEHAWSAGARMLFYTDGLIEARNKQGDFFPLEDYLHTMLTESVEDALNHLVDQLMRHTGDQMRDDMALVLAEHR